MAENGLPCPKALNQGKEILEVFFDLAYPLLDSLLLSISFAGVLIFLSGKIDRVWMFLVCAMALNAVADLAFSYLTLFDIYYTGHPIDLFWILGYFMFALAFHEQGKIL